jgi:hypothetical protein
MSRFLPQPYLPTLGPNDLGDKAAHRESNSRVNKLSLEDRAFHDWYRFVLSYPPHLVRDYIQSFGLTNQHVILDPFCGTGTTIVEAKIHQISGIGLEANPFPRFASSVKVDWSVNPEELLAYGQEVAENAQKKLQKQCIEDHAVFKGDLNEIPIRTLDAKTSKLLITNSISPLPLHKTLVLLDCLDEQSDKPAYRHARLALANALVYSISNLRFGPEVGVGKIKADTPVVAVWLSEIKKMARDLRLVSGQSFPKAEIILADAREISQVLPPNSIDAVITSPPYPNEKDYTRTTRLESVVLGFIRSQAELRAFKQSLVRSNTRSVYKSDMDDAWITNHVEIQRVAQDIEKRRVELGKTSGFEKLYSQVTRLYFGGMARHFAELRTVLRPGAQLAYVVGDQASYLRIMIRTGQLLAEVAQALGYEVIRIDLFRTRFATATKEELREEVVVLRWLG